MKKSVIVISIILILALIAVSAFLIYDSQKEPNAGNNNTPPPLENPSSDTSDGDILYEINVDDEVVSITATKNGKTITEDFEMTAKVDDFNIITIPNIGKVVLILESNGEYQGIVIYQLIKDEIVSIGKIEDVSLMVKDVTYIVEPIDNIYAIHAFLPDESLITEKFEMNGEITNIEIVEIDIGCFVLITTVSDNISRVPIYRLTQSNTGNITGIKQVGLIQHK